MQLTTFNMSNYNWLSANASTSIDAIQWNSKPFFSSSDILANTAVTLLFLISLNMTIWLLSVQLHKDGRAYPRFPGAQKSGPNPNSLKIIEFKLLCAVPFAMLTAMMGITCSNSFPSSIASFVGRWALMFAVYDLCLYTIHYLQHAVSVMFKHHKLHHTVKMNVWDVQNGDAADFIEAFWGIIIIPYFLSFNFIEVAIIAYLLEVHGALAHSGVSIPFMDDLDWFLVGPRFHLAHHVFHNGNYGTFLTVWDHVFGTAISYERTMKRLMAKGAWVD